MVDNLSKGTVSIVNTKSTKNTGLKRNRKLLRMVDDIFQKFDAYHYNSDNLTTEKNCELWTITVPWSGGCDSTALALALRLKYPYTKINLVSIIMNSIPNKGTDKSARIAIRREFERNNLEFKYRDIYINDMSGFSADTTYEGSGQGPIWNCILPMVLNDKSNVCISYVAGDTAWHTIHDFKTSFHCLTHIKGIRANLVFPLEYVDKISILKFLKEAKLLDLCSYCGFPREDNTPCGVCSSCLRHNIALYMLEHEKEFESEKPIQSMEESNWVYADMYDEMQKHKKKPRRNADGSSL